MPARTATSVKPASAWYGITRLDPSPPTAWVTSAARNTPSPIPSVAPISAVMMLSWRIMRRAWRRVMPIVRSIPISRVRSNTESTIVLTMPNRLTMTEKPEQHVEHRQHRGHVLGGVLRVGGPGVEGRVAEVLGRGLDRRGGAGLARRAA